MTGRPEYLHAAGKLRKFLALWLIDPVHGGVYWEIAPDGSPVCGKKQSYAIGFAVYGLSEYVRATGDPEALDEAAALFGSLEEHVWDAMRGGYVEALTRNWQPLEDMRLSEKDANTYFSMNTHLHLLEPYANLLRVWREDRVATAVRKLIHIHTDRLFDPQTGHLNLFSMHGGSHRDGRSLTGMTSRHRGSSTKPPSYSENRRLRQMSVPWSRHWQPRPSRD